MHTDANHGVNLLASIPAELLSETVLYFLPGNDLDNLRSIARVSRAWNALATPLLYHTVDVRVLQTLLVSPELRRHVRRLELPYIDTAAYVDALFRTHDDVDEPDSEVGDTTIPKLSGPFSGWETPHVLYRQYRCRSDDNGRALCWKHSLLAESNIVMPSQAQIAEFKLEKLLLDELRARNKVAQAVLLLHLLPALRDLDILWLEKEDPYMLHPFPDPLASLGGFDGVVPAGYANITRFSYKTWTWCDMDIESVRKIFFLPSLESISFAGTDCGAQWPSATAQQIPSLYGTSSVTEIIIEDGRLMPNVLADFIRLPRRLLSIRCLDVQGNVAEYDLGVVGAALRQHKESLVILDMTWSGHSCDHIEGPDHTVNSLGDFSDFTSLRTLKARYLDIVGGNEREPVQTQRLPRLLPSSLRELTVYDSCLRLSTRDDERSISDILRFDYIRCRENCQDLLSLQQIMRPTGLDACFS